MGTNEPGWSECAHPDPSIFLTNVGWLSGDIRMFQRESCTKLEEQQSFQVRQRSLSVILIPEAQTKKERTEIYFLFAVCF
jgi:hypothetical protein